MYFSLEWKEVRRVKVYVTDGPGRAAGQGVSQTSTYDDRSVQVVSGQENWTPTIEAGESGESNYKDHSKPKDSFKEQDPLVPIINDDVFTVLNDIEDTTKGT